MLRASDRTFARPVVLAALAALLATGLAAVAAPDGGYVEGRVTDESGRPIDGVCVSADSINPPLHGTGVQGSGRAKTNADGTYRITGLEEPGDYRVEFKSCGEKNVAPELFNNRVYFGDSKQGAMVDVVTPPASGIDASLGEGGSIEGMVVGSDGTPAAACVHAYSQTAGSGEAVTDPSGKFAVKGLAAGDFSIIMWAGTCSWRIHAHKGPYRSLTSSVDLGDEVVPVALESTTPVGTTTVLRFAEVRGQVTYKSGDVPERVCVQASRQDTRHGANLWPSLATLTDAHGRFSFGDDWPYMTEGRWDLSVYSHRRPSPSGGPDEFKCGGRLLARHESVVRVGPSATASDIAIIISGRQQR